MPEMPPSTCPLRSIRRTIRQEGLQVLSLFALDRYAEVADLAEKRIAKGSSDAAMVEILGRAQHEAASVGRGRFEHWRF